MKREQKCCCKIENVIFVLSGFKLLLYDGFLYDIYDIGLTIIR